FHQEKKNTKLSRPQQKKSVFITALICITTDLGDDFLAEDVDLVATWAQHSPRDTIEQTSLTWRAGSRQLAISMGPYSIDHVSQHEAVFQIRTQNIPQDILGVNTTPLVISGCSAPFKWQSEPAEKLIQREFKITNNKSIPSLKIWEETGNSIARHIWDAALASIILLNQSISGTGTAIPILDQLLKPRTSPLQAVELGAGCGIVGIALATMLDHCNVVLTDLPEVEKIVMLNLEEAHLQPSSSVEYKNLDWDEPPPDLCSRPIDLILVSDCTYNADSLPTLVSVLDRLVRTSPDAMVLVALKRRHESEAIFFDLMKSAAFVAQPTTVPLPSQHEQNDTIELYCYRREISDV
ncbi:hypothetical protein N7466_004752, partial [Penicillium verhagenii]|uniref:uncharacterized protein n=1 Tax=Penicillium verhagenii TaxID=1562060 RepID=UPI002545B608